MFMAFAGLSKALGIFGFGLAVAVALPAQTFTTLINFDGSNGQSPQLPPIQGVDGNVYGATFAGGLYGAGSIFRMTTKGQLTTVYNFCAQSGCPDGQFPFAALAQGNDGNCYGTTLNGGTQNNGTIFKFALQGVLTTLYSFCAKSNCADGSSPSQVLPGSDGNFYGTTLTGGAHRAGTIFRLTPQGTFATLYSFCSQPNCADGYDYDESQGTMVQATDGNFYGTTDIGGNTTGECAPYGCGTAFKITPQGKFTTVYTFCSVANCADGTTPYWLIQGADGSFYGAAGGGGSNKLIGGTIFRLTAEGQLTTLYSFCAEANCADGEEAIDLVQAADGGNFYGTTFRGGSGRSCTGGCGTVFEITPAGVLTTLHSFNHADGSQPYGIAQATNGKFYGITPRGGEQSDGTVYSLETGLPRFVEILPQSGDVGARVLVLGTNLTGATSVSFNGRSAKFKVVSASEITAAVPAGASTGTVEVTVPAGSLSSKVAFQVE
jgi:uncharacterized repeat protein (TIGR03803 family)